MREIQLVLEFGLGVVLGLVFLEIVPVGRIAKFLESLIEKKDP